MREKKKKICLEKKNIQKNDGAKGHTIYSYVQFRLSTI